MSRSLLRGDNIQNQLEFILYQTRITYEHEMFIISFLTDKEIYYKEILKDNIKKYQALIKEILLFSNNKLSYNFINSNTLYTTFTKKIEENTIKYFDIGLDLNVTQIIEKLKPGNLILNDQNIKKINQLTKKLYTLLTNSKQMLNSIYKYINNGQLFLTIYPLAIKHIIDETTILENTLERIIKKEKPDPTYVYTLEYFYTNFLQEHSLIIKNMVNPNQNEIIILSNNYLNQYQELLKKFNNNISPYSINEIYNECQYITNNFQSLLFKITKIVEKNTSNFMILPLITDHLLRESYCYMMNLKYSNNN